MVVGCVVTCDEGLLLHLAGVILSQDVRLLMSLLMFLLLLSVVTTGGGAVDDVDVVDVALAAPVECGEMG